MKKYNTAYPYFPQADISGILKKFKDILSGKGLLTMGAYVKVFENKFAEYVGSRFAVATNSCTSALEIALASVGLKENDEVVVPVQTFIATGSSVIASGGKITFCEIDRNFLLDFESLKKSITNRTKAVIIVHFAGLIHPQISEIKIFLKNRHIYLIEDAAHAHGAKIGNVFSGNIGDLGCFSFFSTKIMTTGEGGMITTNSREFYKQCSSLRNRGLDTQSPTEVFSELGGNSRLTEVQAILGIYQLKRLEEFIRHRNRMADRYMETLWSLKTKGIIDFQEYPDNIRNAYWKFIIFLKDCRLSREGIKKRLSRFGIKIDWPYQPLLHLQPVFKKMYKMNKGFFRKSESLANTHFCLPIHLGIKEKDALFIANKIKGFFV